MRVTVRLFGPQSDAVGAASIDVDLTDGATCADIRAALADSTPALRASLPASRFAINHEFVGDDHVVSQADEVALIGLVSGG